MCGEAGAKPCSEPTLGLLSVEVPLLPCNETLIHLVKLWPQCLSVGKPCLMVQVLSVGYPSPCTRQYLLFWPPPCTNSCPQLKLPGDYGGSPTVPSSSLRISLVYRARDCRCTVFVAGTRSLAVVGTRPGARNWLASAFSEEEVCRSRKGAVTRGARPQVSMTADQAEVPLLTSFSACSIPFRKSTFREYSLSTSEAGLLEGEKRKRKAYCAQLRGGS